MATFESYFTSEISQMIAGGEFDRAVERIEEIFSQMGSDFDRSEAYHWLACLNINLGGRAMSNRDVTRCREHFTSALEFAEKALDLFPNRPDTVLYLARIYINPFGQPERAFPYLEPFAEGHRIQPDALMFYDHTRKVLRGVVLAIHGSEDEAFDEWREAFSGDYLRLHPSRLDFNSFFLLAGHRVELPAARTLGLLAMLSELGCPADQVATLRKLLVTEE